MIVSYRLVLVEHSKRNDISQSFVIIFGNFSVCDGTLPANELYFYLMTFDVFCILSSPILELLTFCNACHTPLVEFSSPVCMTLY